MLTCISQRFIVEGCMHCCKCGELDKSDPYIFIGEYLNMTCTLYQNTAEKGDNSSKLYFSHTINGIEIEVPENETFIINSTSLTMNKMMSSILYDGPYYCNLRNPVSTNNSYVGRTWIELEYPPKRVNATNFNCIIYDWDRSMVCTWDLGVEYKNINNINTTLFIFLDGNYGSCPNKRLTNCTWNNDDGVTFDRKTMYFIVTVTNTKHNISVSSGWIPISQNDHVKPDKVDYLISRAVNSTCILLEWRHQKQFRTKEFIITYSSKWNNRQRIETNDINKKIICGLKPNTNYNFEIVTVPEGGKGYESDPVFNSTSTDIDLPARSPEVSDGGYIVNKDDCTYQERSITVYWKSIPEEYQNGPMIGYYITASNSDGHLFDIAVNNPNQMVQTMTLPCQQTIISIKSWGEAGNSTTVSTISIHENFETSRPTLVIVEAQKNSTDTTVNVTWSLRHPVVKSCTVYYCQYITECTRELQWVDVPGNYSSKVIDRIQFDKKFRFGVSCNGSGFEWQTCYYFKSIEPSPPNTVEVTAYPENSITVDWSVPVCENSPYIVYYIIKWCIADRSTKKCAGSYEEKKMPSTETSSHVISDLEVDTTYGIMVKQEAGDGRVSEYSEMQFVEPTNSDLRKEEIVGISIASLFLFMLAIAGVVFICRQAAPRIRHIKRPYAIDTIDIKTSDLRMRYSLPSSSSSSTSSAGDHSSSDKLVLSYKKGKEYISQISKDSGRSSLTSDTLHSPGIDGKSVELFSVEEESSGLRHSNNSNHKTSSDHNKNQQILDPYYSRVTIDVIPHMETQFRQEAFNQNITAAPVRASFPSIQNRYSHSSDRFSLVSQTTSTNTLGYKSSSEEKMLLNLNADDNEDGYKDLDGRCKSLDAVCTRSLHDDDNLSSYVRHAEEVNSSTTQNTALDSSSHNPLSYIPQSDTQNDFVELRNLNLSPSKMISLEYKPRQEKDTIDLNNISPEVTIRDLNQTQDSQNSKGDFYCMNANDNPKLHVPLMPLIELKDEDSYMSNSNCVYISEEDAIGHGNLIANQEHDQQETSSSYVSEMKTELMDGNESFSGSSEVEINGGYVTEENFRVLVNIADENSVTSTDYNRQDGGYVAEQELLNCSNNSDESSGISANEDSRL